MRPPTPLARLARFPIALLLAACGGSSGGDTSAESSSSSDDEDSGDDGGESLAYGYIPLHFEAAEGGDPFAGTDTVIATLSYGECLANFYADHPQLLQYAIGGAPVFGSIAAGGEGWQDRLCAGNVGEHVDCSIIWITQQFDQVHDLTVSYRVNAPLGGGRLLFGPIPTASTSGCAMPEMTTMATAVSGKDADDHGIWQVESYAPSSGMTGQDEPIVVSVTAIE